MALQAGTDYVFAPKTTWVLGQSGVVYGFVVGFRDRIVMLPKDAIGGAGRTITTTRFSVGGKPMLGAAQEMLADPSTTTEEVATALGELAQSNPDGLLVLLAPLKSLRVKTGWFSKGVYWKMPEHRGWRGLPLGSAAPAFLEFYRTQLREG